jgi:hypothetical protein
MRGFADLTKRSPVTAPIPLTKSTAETPSCCTSRWCGWMLIVHGKLVYLTGVYVSAAADLLAAMQLMRAELEKRYGYDSRAMAKIRRKSELHAEPARQGLGTHRGAPDRQRKDAVDVRSSSTTLAVAA